MSDDLINRQAAIDVINHELRCGAVIDQCGLETAHDLIEELPSAEPKKGRWIKTARWGRVYYCDQCRNYLDFDGVNAGRGSTNFCPNCGADMRGERNEP